MTWKELGSGKKTSEEKEMEVLKMKMNHLMSK